MTEKHLIGLSLSFCVKDILSGKVNESDVICIVTNTSFNFQDEEIEKLINLYHVYWESFQANDIKELLLRLEPVIYQPKRDAKTVFRIGKNHWYETVKQ